MSCPSGWVWASDGRTGYTVQEATGSLPRGTSITLHLKADAKEFLDSFKIGLLWAFSVTVLQLLAGLGLALLLNANLRGSSGR